MDECVTVLPSVLASAAPPPLRRFEPLFSVPAGDSTARGEYKASGLKIIRFAYAIE